MPYFVRLVTTKRMKTMSLRNNTLRVVGHGKDVNFWHARWVGYGPLCKKFHEELTKFLVLKHFLNLIFNS